MRATECLVWVVVHHIRTKIARSSDAQNRIHVGAIQIDQATMSMDQFGDLFNLMIKQAKRIRIGDHEDGGLLIDLAFQVGQVDQAVRSAFHRNSLKARHLRAGRIGSVRTIWSQNDGAVLANLAEVSGSHHQRGQLAVRSCGWLQRYRWQTRNLRKIILHIPQDFQQALDCRFRLIGMNVDQARKQS